jgi:hypothetical protein
VLSTHVQLGGDLDEKKTSNGNDRLDQLVCCGFMGVNESEAAASRGMTELQS